MGVKGFVLAKSVLIDGTLFEPDNGDEDAFLEAVDKKDLPRLIEKGVIVVEDDVPAPPAAPRLALVEEKGPVDDLTVDEQHDDEATVEELMAAKNSNKTAE